MAKTLGTPWQKLGHEVPASELEGVDLYWRASNYLSVGQIYLRSNPLMRADFVDEKTGETRDFGRPDVKHRLVGHWGTTPGINFLFGHGNMALLLLISALGVGLAVFNLILDFDYIEQGIAMQAPASESWRAAFGLTVTLVWLYIEMLRLLSYFRSN